ncbi:MAG: hypothetical protein LBV26_00925 [Bacteroidales bacterium]|jgi:hypothetical protein|nr:hypothetical protein [Bacteroidales bacterium]
MTPATQHNRRSNATENAGKPSQGACVTLRKVLAQRFVRCLRRPSQGACAATPLKTSAWRTVIARVHPKVLGHNADMTYLLKINNLRNYVIGNGVKQSMFCFGLLHSVRNDGKEFAMTKMIFIYISGKSMTENLKNMFAHDEK